MKKYFLLFFLMAFVGLLLSSCKNPIYSPPPPLTPTFTPTPQPGTVATPISVPSGCVSVLGPNLLTSSYSTGWGGGTPGWSGFAPPSGYGVAILQTAADWQNYIANSVDPAATTPIPFNPSTQVLVVLTLPMGGSCPNGFVFTGVCNTGTQIQVNYTETQSCCGTVMVYMGMGTTAFIVNTNGLPVVLNPTYIPYIGPKCM